MRERDTRLWEVRDGIPELTHLMTIPFTMNVHYNHHAFP